MRKKMSTLKNMKITRQIRKVSKQKIKTKRMMNLIRKNKINRPHNLPCSCLAVFLLTCCLCSCDGRTATQVLLGSLRRKFLAGDGSALLKRLMSMQRGWILPCDCGLPPTSLEAEVVDEETEKSPLCLEDEKYWFYGDC